jgi:hypothetical protein
MSSSLCREGGHQVHTNGQAMCTQVVAAAPLQKQICLEADA